MRMAKGKCSAGARVNLLSRRSVQAIPLPPASRSSRAAAAAAAVLVDSLGESHWDEQAQRIAWIPAADLVMVCLDPVRHESRPVEGLL